MSSARSWRLWSRVVLAGPVTLALAFVVMAGSAIYLPGGAAGINNIVMPVLLLPAIWAVFFFYAYLDSKLWRAWAVLLAVLVLHVALIAYHLSASGAAAGVAA